MQQEHLDAGGIGNDVIVTATGSQAEVKKPQSSWQILARLPSVTIGMATYTRNGYCTPKLGAYPAFASLQDSFDTLNKLRYHVTDNLYY